MQKKRVLLAVLLAAASSFSLAGDQPGLEVFDADGGAVQPVYDYQPYPGPATGYSPFDEEEELPPVIVPDGGTYVDPYDQPVTTTVMPEQPETLENDPFAQPDRGDVFSDPYDEEYGEQFDSPAPDAASVPENAVDEPVARTIETPRTFESFYPADPVQATLADINTRNRDYPGLFEATATRDINAVASVIWQALRERRVLDATLQRGPGASAGYANPHEMQRMLQLSRYVPVDDDNSPMAAAGRINEILDAFSQPVIDDPGFAACMASLLVRLHDDIAAIRGWLFTANNNGESLELSRTYIRAATTCDFFIFPRREFSAEMNTVYQRSGSMFYRDGASIAGDVGGVTGGLLSGALMLNEYTQGDSRYRRDMQTVWSAMERPARYALELAFPDMTLPRIGPRGVRELSIEEVMRLNEIFPRQPGRRVGLSVSHSFPPVSNAESYGGIFVTRSGYDTLGRYLAVRFGPLGIMGGIPGHRDFGTLELMSRGVKFLVDGGGYGGAASLPEAHSGLSLDDNYVLDTTYNEPGVPVSTLWRTNAGMDFVSDRASFADGKTWQRTVVYVKDLPGEALSDYWVVLDTVDMQNDNQPHQARIRYQLAPGIQAYHDGAGIVATANYSNGSALRVFAIDSNSELTVAEGDMGVMPSFVYDPFGGQMAAPSVVLTRTLVGDSTTSTLLYPAENMNHRPARIERDADLIRGRTGAIVVDHGHGRIDVIAWAPPGTELVTPTLNLQMSADLGIFRLRNGKIMKVNFVNLENFQAKEPDGGLWSMRVDGPAQTLSLEPAADGGWQVLSDPANQSSATLYEANFGPGVSRRRIPIRPGELRVLPR